MRTWILASVLLILPLVGACHRKSDNDDDGKGEARASVDVKVATALKTELVPTIDLVGALESIPERTVVLSSQLGGFVSRVAVQEGQAVHAGDPIVVLDTRLTEADVAKAAAAVDEAKANLSLLKKGPLPGEVEAAKQDAQTAVSAADAKRAKLSALEPLRAKGEISNVQMDIAKADAAQADATSKAASERLKVMSLGTRPELVQQAEAHLKSAESELATHKLNLDLCTIKAPIDGVITQLPVRQGMSVDKVTTLATLVDLSALYANVRIPATFLTQVHEGAKATATLKDMNMEPREGTVARIGKEAELRTGDVSTWILVKNDDSALRPGLGCSVKISLPAIPDAIVVPVSAIAANTDGDSVVTVIRDGKAYQTTVTIGAHGADDVQITEGINAGDIVATEGGYALPNECPVNIVKGEKTDDSAG